MEAAPVSVLIQTAASWYITGSIWTMQILNYPLLARIDAGSFAAYETAHNRRFLPVVGPGVLAAIVATVSLLTNRAVSLSWGPIATAVLLSVVIISTVAYQGRDHARLATGFDAKVHATLVRSNWIRTLAWTAIGGLDLWMLTNLLRSPR